MAGLARRVALLALVGLLSACAGKRAGQPYDQESFDARSRFSREFVASPADTCSAARRALLSQGYVAQQTQPEQLQAHKRFQPDGDTHIQIDFTVVCAPSAKGQPTTVVFVSAIQDRYALKKSSTSASVGVGPIGSISLPIASSSEAMVKVGSQTIPSGPFYERFFDLVETMLAEQQGLD